MYLGDYSVSGRPEPVWLSMRQADPEIPDGDYSLPEPVDDAQQLRYRIKFAGVPATPVTIEIASDPTFSDAIVLDTIAPSGTDTLYFWTSDQNVILNGITRINNTSGETIEEVRVNKLAATVG